MLLLAVNACKSGMVASYKCTSRERLLAMSQRAIKRDGDSSTTSSATLDQVHAPSGDAPRGGRDCFRRFKYSAIRLYAKCRHTRVQIIRRERIDSVIVVTPESLGSPVIGTRITVCNILEYRWRNDGAGILELSGPPWNTLSNSAFTAQRNVVWRVKRRPVSI
jgi:hypothetical protein